MISAAPLLALNVPVNAVVIPTSDPPPETVCQVGAELDPFEVNTWPDVP